MATLSRLAFAFGAPAIIMASALGVVWLSTSRLDTATGPNRPILFMPPPRLSPASEPNVVDAPKPPPNADEPVPRWQAEARNASIPFSQAPRLSAARFSAAADQEASLKALQCMTSAIYYESEGEPDAGKRAVAQVVINRWANPAFPKTICGVIEQGAPAPGCQFSFMCDGSLAKKPSARAWTNDEAIARAALNGYVEASVGASTHYHADYVVPLWAGTMLKLVKLGRHIFYRWPGTPAYMGAPPLAPVALTPAPADASGGKSIPMTAPSPANPPAAAAPEPPRSTSPEDAPRRSAATDRLAAAPAPQTKEPATAPPATALQAPKPSPWTEPPRRPVPPPSLRVGPI